MKPGFEAIEEIGREEREAKETVGGGVRSMESNREEEEINPEIACAVPLCACDGRVSSETVNSEDSATDEEVEGFI